MAQWRKGFAAELDDQSPDDGVHGVEGRNLLCKLSSGLHTGSLFQAGIKLTELVGLQLLPPKY